ncbi:MAG: hypothetical protein CSA49_05815 [Gammaproteobacteria bacterium]|nr:MAG: hypothetical protein CSA49_05815 [Gammaproteobacteria bacterium]
MPQQFAPGARVEIRDAEWVIRRVDLTSGDGYQLTCDGISELVRGKEASAPPMSEKPATYKAGNVITVLTRRPLTTYTPPPRPYLIKQQKSKPEAISVSTIQKKK